MRTISDHIKKVYSDSELEETATIRKFRIVQTEGSRQVQREVNHYNLQMICLLYTSDAADEEDSVDLGGRRIIKKKKREDTKKKKT